MFSPLFTKIAASPAKELRIVRVRPDGYEPLAVPFNNLTLRRAVDTLASPFHCSHEPKQHNVFPAAHPLPDYKPDWVDIEPTKIVKSIEEAEETVLNLTYLDTPQTFSQSAVTGTVTYIGDSSSSLGILINRASNLIAAQTRRYAGNLIFMHPDVLEILKSEFSSALGLIKEEKIGLWLKAGYFNSNRAVYTNPDFTKDRVIVAYSGIAGDGPAQLVNRDGQTYLAIHKSATQYMKAILIEK